MVNNNSKELQVIQGPTWIKQQPNADAGMLTESEKFPLEEGATLAIKPHHAEIQGHYQIKLLSPRNGVTVWYAYKPHVKIV